jgi:hypothetical protein
MGDPTSTFADDPFGILDSPAHEETALNVVIFRVPINPINLNLLYAANRLRFRGPL